MGLWNTVSPFFAPLSHLGSQGQGQMVDNVDVIWGRKVKEYAQMYVMWTLYFVYIKQS